MTKYEGQREDGAVELLGGETPGLIFTEADRRRAFTAIQGAQEGEQFDFATMIRLDALANKGDSHQAGFLLRQLIATNPDAVIQEHQFMSYIEKNAQRDRSGLVADYDSHLLWGPITRARLDLIERDVARVRSN